jgi:hypothetical protein
MGMVQVISGQPQQFFLDRFSRVFFDIYYYVIDGRADPSAGIERFAADISAMPLGCFPFSIFRCFHKSIAAFRYLLFNCGKSPLMRFIYTSAGRLLIITPFHNHVCVSVYRPTPFRFISSRFHQYLSLETQKAARLHFDNAIGRLVK